MLAEAENLTTSRCRAVGVVFAAHCAEDPSALSTGICTRVARMETRVDLVGSRNSLVLECPWGAQDTEDDRVLQDGTMYEVRRVGWQYSSGQLPCRAGKTSDGRDKGVGPGVLSGMHSLCG
ncbi:hypothetical protein DHEL01_v201050 [Diaporthe helianthi]|uniref:Uncharacterized protein n=1 Tax=Diaporthe helianthi TaxID=158607 RepID=A0A2P5IDJ4_DIAHE|nr:hypothetical protein DHEL01_v201050 [Diaporthe helianthi]